jgi:hypothetical protein
MTGDKKNDALVIKASSLIGKLLYIFNTEEVMLKGIRKEKGLSAAEFTNDKKKRLFNIQDEFSKNTNKVDQRLWLTNNAPFFSSTAVFICKNFLSLRHKFQRLFFPQLELHEQKQVLYAWKARLDKRYKAMPPSDNDDSPEIIVYNPTTFKST